MAFLLVFVSGVAVAVWHHGIFFGPILSVVWLLPLAMFSQWVADRPRYGLLGRRRVLLVALLALGAAGCSHFLLRPPGAAELFEKHLGFPVPADVRELRSWSYQCGIDPGYGLRFYAGQQTLDRIAATMRTVATTTQPALESIWHGFPQPQWWKPEEIVSPRHVAKHIRDSQDPTLLCLIDRQTGLVYFMILYH